MTPLSCPCRILDMYKTLTIFLVLSSGCADMQGPDHEPDAAGEQLVESKYFERAIPGVLDYLYVVPNIGGEWQCSPNGWGRMQCWQPDHAQGKNIDCPLLAEVEGSGRLVELTGAVMLETSWPRMVACEYGVYEP